MTRESYDFIVIGAGSGGIGLAAFANMAGFRTLLVDKSDRSIGGDCLNFGCVPSKALIHAARLAQAAREAGRFGLEVRGKADLAAVLADVRAKQDVIRAHENADFFRGQGLSVALGAARFAGPDAVEIDGRTYRGRRIVIATGSSPRPLEVPGADQPDIRTNETIFGLDALPERLLVVGGGPIGMELGQAFQMLGSQVVVVHRGPRILPKEPPWASEILRARMEEQGVRFLLSSQVKRFEGPRQAVVADESGAETSVSFDVALASIGRRLGLDGLALERAGIETDASGKLVLNRRLQTTNRRVFATGDVVGQHLFSHAAEMHTRLLINNFLSPVKKKLDTRHFSWVTFTDPEVATFGQSPAQLEERGAAFETLEFGFGDDDRAVTDGYRYGKLALQVGKANLLGRGQTLLGGTVVAPGAGEIAQELILATAQGLTIDALFEKIYPYPTASRVNQLAVVKRKERSLTPRLKPWLRLAFRLFG